MILQDLMAALESVAPFSLQEDYDNSGIQLGHPGFPVSRGLICLDVTPQVVDEAVRKNCDVIISHHPLLFKGVKKLGEDNPLGQIVFRAIRANIAIVSFHTNFDNVEKGVNQALGNALGIEGMKILEPKNGLLKKLVVFCPRKHAEALRNVLFSAGAGHIGNYDRCSFSSEGKGSFRAGDEANPFVGDVGVVHEEEEVRVEVIFPAYIEHKLIQAMKDHHPYEEVAYDVYALSNAFEKAGSGMLGQLPEPLSVTDFLNLVKDRLGVPFLKYTDYAGQTVQNVAFCGGAGAFLIPSALQSGAQAFISGDFKYHDYFSAGGNMLLVDAGHYETEQLAKQHLVEHVKKKIVNFALLNSETVTNPVRYF